MRVSIHKPISNPEQFKQQLLTWSQQFREVVYLDSNSHTQQYSNFDCVLAVDAFTSLKTDFQNAFDDLKQYQQTTKDWLFGYLTYDLKNDVEELKTANFDGLNFPDLFFFQPKKIFLLKGNQLEIRYLLLCDDEVEEDFNEIVESQKWKVESAAALKIEQRISKESYIEKVNEMLHHIHIGDMYEANFCMEFYAENAIINPLEKFLKLNEISKAPFSVFFKNHKQYLLSASPERYLKKEGETIISQPIKGTSKRSSNQIEDEKSKQFLESDSKERAENIMITDLVRNDLSHTAQKGSVEVAELCKIYSFLQVHQMISTITSKLDSQYAPVDVLKTTFPMGSMTGAPKISVMKIIENLEETKRGLYSGAVGYFTPEGDFDFNVVIRSILYNQENEYVSFSVGSAITAQSDPEKEYEECLLKAKAMHEVLR
ncbi:anthranilate synthase component I family protein [Flavobacterium saccharophilum]|uniref:Para-aminobenzoate synthetase component 1 n=1 Tax=Flavobacterium saccharophilum TaxID=29534 RepID=A0A1M7MAD7_9FLAO|nr:anthranilate synthase component I family protein [Flavobacterium saccharophilum]SHM87770.1 para-aminobenzoate synthetase component 1 [Flavobacterium saccharophilum]